MSISKKLSNFLKKNKIKFKEIKHKTVFTAFDKAKTLKVPEKKIGKTLILKANGNFAVCLISADKNLDKKKFQKVLNSWRKKDGKKPIKKITFATENWMKKNLKGVKVGAIPPFGNLWGLPTFIDKSLFKNKKIIVSGGDYTQSVEINPNVFKKLVPDLVIGSFSKKRK
jgi:Ala-tRNA(Pro) deacylase